MATSLEWSKNFDPILRRLYLEITCESRETEAKKVLANLAGVSSSGNLTGPRQLCNSAVVHRITSIMREHVGTFTKAILGAKDLLLTTIR
jgi:hypothetical protein